MSIQSELNRIVSNIENAYTAIKQKGGTVPSSKTSTNLASSIATISTESIPSGAIIMWSGSSTNIPSGWALCNGQNGTPNLIGRFVLGADNTTQTEASESGPSDQYPPHETGGEATVKLTILQLPAHDHIERVGDNGQIKDAAYLSRTSSSSYRRLESTTIGMPTSVLTTGATGGNESHNNMPPYYTLCYIMKL